MEDHGWARWSGMQLMQLGNNWKAVGKRLGDHIWERTGRCMTLWGTSRTQIGRQWKTFGKTRLEQTGRHLPPFTTCKANTRQVDDKWDTKIWNTSGRQLASGRHLETIGCFPQASRDWSYSICWESRVWKQQPAMYQPHCLFAWGMSSG